MLLSLAVFFVYGAVFWASDDWVVGFAEPDCGKEWLAIDGCGAYEGNRAVHHYTRGGAFEVFGYDLTVMPEWQAEDFAEFCVFCRVPGRDVTFRGEGFVVIPFPWRCVLSGSVLVVLREGGSGFAEGSEVPFSEVAGCVAERFAHFGYGDFLRGQIADTCGKDAVAEIMTACQAGASRWRAHRAGGEEACKTYAVCGHSVEVRRFDDFIAVETRIPISHIIGHNENDIGFVFLWFVREQRVCVCTSGCRSGSGS